MDLDFEFATDLPGAPPLPAFSLVSPGSILTDYVPLFTVGGRERSGKWAKVSRDFLRRNPECPCCGRRAVVTHHAKPSRTTCSPIWNWTRTT